jgi:hypothetical protein
MSIDLLACVGSYFLQDSVFMARIFSLPEVNFELS